MLTLYYFPASCSLAVHIALEETGLPYQLELVALKHGEQQKPEYLRVNPLGLVPALRTETGEVLTEVQAILTYIALLSQDKLLLPSDPWELARAVEWMSLFSSSVHIAFAGFFRPQRFTDDAAAAEALKRDGQQRFMEKLKFIDQRLAESRYVLGEAYSVCDPYALVFYLWAVRLKFDTQELPKYRNLVRRLLERPAVRSALEQEQMLTLLSSAA